MEQEILQEMGFTVAESKIYLALLGIGSVQVGRIIEKTGLQSSTVHNTINTLVEKGFVTYILEGKIKMYHAVEPQFVLKSYLDHAEKFKELLPALERKAVSKQSTAEVFEGTKGIMVLIDHLISEAKKGDTYYFFALDESTLNEEIQEFFLRYDAKRKERGLDIRGVAREELRPLFEKRKSLKMRYVDYQIPSNISICNSHMAMIAWGEKPTGILITSELLIQNQIKFFEEVWKSGKK